MCCSNTETTYPIDDVASGKLKLRSPLLNSRSIETAEPDGVWGRSTVAWFAVREGPPGQCVPVCILHKIVSQRCGPTALSI